MKTLLILAIAMLSPQTFAISGQSISPDKVVTPLVDIFNSSNKKLSEEKMEVRVSTYNQEGAISQGKAKLEMAIGHYLDAKKQSSAVFRMIPSQAAPASEDGIIYMGTAFHIGENLVLTNHHVLSYDRSNTTECGGFELHGNQNSDSFSCKKVHYCNAENDVCLIEMAPAKRCLNAFCSKKIMIELKQGEALKLKAEPEMNIETMDSVVMTCIGNTMGLGIHYSQGRGMRLNNDQIYFFAPLRSGNSGGPLFGHDGLVWGVVKQESGIKVGTDAYNIALSMNKVISLMREQLVNDKVTLEKFNKAVVP